MNYRKTYNCEIADEAKEDEMEEAIEYLLWIQPIDAGHISRDIVDSGAKDQLINIMQMFSYLGQQYISGEYPNLRGNRGDIESTYID
jgi:hypothetical protein